MPTAPVRYQITPVRPEAHLFEVRCTVADPEPTGQRFSLPAWIPGSYLIREFARHVVSARATQRGRELALRKIDKHTWQCAPARGPVTVTLEVYANDLSVRGAFLDTTRAFFNGTSVFLRVEGHESSVCLVDLRAPRGRAYRRWRVATTLPRAEAPAYGFGGYRAADYDELIDHPVELGTFALATFRAHGVPHDIAITGRQDADLDRLCRDLKRLCETQIDLFGRPAPMRRYLFLVTALGDGYGGLEHRASTALVCSREDLPRPGDAAINDSYRTFLGLCSHEYFHTWNVKRIKPAAFAPYDLTRENYTGLLWAMEGITSYYDDLMLVRSGLISQDSYLELLGRALTSHLRTGGRLRQTVADASHDAWIKYYRQDENSPNVLVSYYLKGSLVALCLDLILRQKTRGRKSLDDLMRLLWTQYGLTGSGIPEDGVERAASQIAGSSLKRFFDLALRSTEELPLRSLLAEVGLDMQLRQASSSSDKGGTPGPQPALTRAALGARIADDAAGARITHVLEGGAAQQAGLSAGDVVVALDGLRVNARNLEQRLSAHAADSQVAAHFFRRDELFATQIRVTPAPVDTCNLTAVRGAAERKRRNAWLSG